MPIHRGGCVLVLTTAFALVLFSGRSLHAQESPFCASSLAFPAGLHLVEAPTCFSLDLAEELASTGAPLGAYLDRFSDTPATRAYRYWYYLRAGRFLPALLTLIETVNGARSLEPAMMFRDEIPFLVMNGIKQIPPDVNLFGKSGELADAGFSHRFFFILDQVAVLYADRNGGLRRDAWLLYRTFALFFSSIGIPRNDEDPYVDRLLRHFYLLWKDGLLLSYLDFYAFFTGGDGSYLPSASRYAERFSSLVPLPKFQNADKERETIETVTRFVARFILERLSIVPELEFVDTDDVRAWHRMMRSTDRVPAEAYRCAVFDTRSEMLSPFKDELFQPLVENRALTIMEGCDPRHEIPFVLTGPKMYLSTSDRWLSDVALVHSLIMHGSFSYREAASLMSDSLLAALGRYLKEGKKRPFGTMLLYAYHTNRIASLRDALFLYRKYAEDADYTTEGRQDTIRFTATFFMGFEDRDP